MRVKISVTQIKPRQSQAITYGTAKDMYVESAQLVFRAGGQSTPLLEVEDKYTGLVYTTDFAWTSATTALDAAAVNGQYVLT